MGGDSWEGLDVENVQGNVARRPNLLLVDTADPMRPRPVDGGEYAKIEAVNRALESFKADVESRYRLDTSVDVSVVTFGGDVTIRDEFVGVTDWDPPTLSTDGEPAPMCEAIVEGAGHLEDYRHRLENEHFPVRESHIWLLTEGNLTDTAERWGDAQTVVEKGTQHANVMFNAVGIGPNPDMVTLEDLISAGSDWRASAFEFEEGVFTEFLREEDFS